MGIETMLVNIDNAQAKSGAGVHICIINNSYNQKLVHAFQKGVSLHFLNRKLQSKGIGFIIRLNRLLMQITP